MLSDTDVARDLCSSWVAFLAGTSGPISLYEVVCLYDVEGIMLTVLLSPCNVFLMFTMSVARVSDQLLQRPFYDQQLGRFKQWPRLVTVLHLGSVKVLSLLYMKKMAIVVAIV